jgi:hypothetical protein
VAREVSSSGRRIALAAAAITLAAVAAAWYVWWTAPPQMGADAEVFTAVDALFTAVTARDDRLLGGCERRLRALKDAGTLPADAAGHLQRVIQTARAGQWEPAAERLYNFMIAQRRDGAREPAATAKRHSGRRLPGSK